jgi:RHS repeat-associated protein
VTASVQAAATIWSFPNLHGDDVITTDGSGNRTGSLAQYDPFGDAINATTHDIGTSAADSAVPSNTTTATASNAWEGSNQKSYESLGDVATIEMGARQYVPLLGRFLSTDPLVGGNENAYNYPTDPINVSDVTGTRACDITCSIFIGTVSIFVGGVCDAFFPVAGVACAAVAGAVDGTVTYLYQWSGTKHFSWLGLVLAAVTVAVGWAIPVGILGTVGRVVAKIFIKSGRPEAAAMITKYWGDVLSKIKGKKH